MFNKDKGKDMASFADETRRQPTKHNIQLVELW